MRKHPTEAHHKWNEARHFHCDTFIRFQWDKGVVHRSALSASFHFGFCLAISSERFLKRLSLILKGVNQNIEKESAQMECFSYTLRKGSYRVIDDFSECTCTEFSSMIEIFVRFFAWILSLLNVSLAFSQSSFSCGLWHLSMHERSRKRDAMRDRALFSMYSCSSTMASASRAATFSLYIQHI